MGRGNFPFLRNLDVTCTLAILGAQWWIATRLDLVLRTYPSSDSLCVQRPYSHHSVSSSVEGLPKLVPQEDFYHVVWAIAENQQCRATCFHVGFSSAVLWVPAHCAHHVLTCCHMWPWSIYPWFKLVLVCAEHGVLSTLPPLCSEGLLEGLPCEMSQTSPSSLHTSRCVSPSNRLYPCTSRFIPAPAKPRSVLDSPLPCWTLSHYIPPTVPA